MTIEILAEPSTALILRAGPLELDVERRALRCRGEAVHLTPIEFALLRVFVEHRNEVLLDQTLCRVVFPTERPANRQKLRTYVSRLRRKLDDRHRTLIRNVHGVGYRLSVRPW